MRVAPWVRIGVSAVVVSVILWRVPMFALWLALEAVRRAWMGLALAAVLAMLAVRCLRWHRLLRAGNVSVARADSARSLLGGFALSVVMPGRLGELGRCLFLPKAARAPVLLLNILDRGLDIWALVTCAVASLFLVVPRPAAMFAVGVWLALLPLVLGLPALVSGLGDLPWWGSSFRVELRAAKQTLGNVPAARFAGWALVSTSLDLVTFYCLLRAFQGVEFKAALATFPWIVIAGGLPVSVSGLGPREGMAALLLADFAVPSAVALDVALLLFAFSALLPALLGGLWLLVPGLQSRHAGWSAELETLTRPA